MDGTRLNDQIEKMSKLKGVICNLAKKIIVLKLLWNYVGIGMVTYVWLGT